MVQCRARRIAGGSWKGRVRVGSGLYRRAPQHRPQISYPSYVGARARMNGRASTKGGPRMNCKPCKGTGRSLALAGGHRLAYSTHREHKLTGREKRPTPARDVQAHSRRTIIASAARTKRSDGQVGQSKLAEHRKRARCEMGSAQCSIERSYQGGRGVF